MLKEDLGGLIGGEGRIYCEKVVRLEEDEKMTKILQEEKKGFVQYMVGYETFTVQGKNKGNKWLGERKLVRHATIFLKFCDMCMRVLPACLCMCYMYAD